jgi:hypothetical protein
MESTNDTQAEVARVAVRLPPFWADQPDMCFAQAEAQFSLAGITTTTPQVYNNLPQNIKIHLMTLRVLRQN